MTEAQIRVIVREELLSLLEAVRATMRPPGVALAEPWRHEPVALWASTLPVGTRGRARDLWANWAAWARQAGVEPSLRDRSGAPPLGEGEARDVLALGRALARLDGRVLGGVRVRRRAGAGGVGVYVWEAVA